MLSFLKPNPEKRLQKEYEKLTEQAFHAQRNGDIRSYSMLTEEAEQVKLKLEATKSQ
jgi:hypothetical protein